MTTEYLRKHNIEMVDMLGSSEEAFTYKGAVVFGKDTESEDICIDSVNNPELVWIDKADQTAFMAALRTLMYGTPTNPEAEVVKVYGNPDYVQVPLPIFDDPNE